jgi:urease beta subunit
VLLCRVNWNVILSTSEQPHNLVQATASIIMGVHYIFKYVNKLLLDRVTPGGVRLSMQMEYMIRMHNYNYEEVQV